MGKDNEWKKLDIDNLPSGLFGEDCELKENNTRNLFTSYEKKLKALEYLIEKRNGEEDLNGYKYRIVHPKAPTHQEIMTKWWHVQGKLYTKVIGYEEVTEIGFTRKVYILAVLPKPMAFGNYVNLSWFVDRESYDIPPE